MTRLEVSGAVRPLKSSLSVKGFKESFNQRGKREILPKNGCVVGACVSFPVANDKVHTHAHARTHAHTRTHTHTHTRTLHLKP